VLAVASLRGRSHIKKIWGIRVLVRVLLLLVFGIALAVPFYDRVRPVLFGFPFFYWYQILMVPVASLLIYVVFRVEDVAGARK